jgi:hypothetical protein
MGQHQGPGTTGQQQVVDPNYVHTQQQPVVGQPGQQPGRDFAAEAARFAEEHIRTPETKEFFKTSEFLVLVLGVIALSIASAVSAQIDAGRMWTMVTIMTTGYLLSRGFSKSGTRRGEDTATSGTSGGMGYAPGGQGYPTGTGGAPDMAHFVEHNIRTPETKEFFKTSEFALWVLGCAGILIASAVAPDIFEATRAWALVTILSIGYMLSRGLSKAGASRADDPDYRSRSDRIDLTEGGSGLGQLAAHVTTPETKEFYKTSEFMVWGLVTFSILLASAVVEIFNAHEAWNLITWLTGGYIVSRGLAKIGTRQETDRRRDLGHGRGTGYAQSGYTQPGYAQPGVAQGYVVPQEQAHVAQTTPMGGQEPGHIAQQ